MRLIRVIVIFIVLITFPLPINAQSCSISLDTTQAKSIELEIEAHPLAANSTEADQDLAKFFTIIQSASKNDEFEIFTAMHTNSKIIYDINGLASNEISKAINSSCAFRRSKKRDIVLRFFSLPDRKLEKIVLLK